MNRADVSPFQMGKFMNHLFSLLLLLILLLVPCHGRVLDDPEYNPEDYTDVNLHGMGSQTEAEVNCESRAFQIYAAIPLSPPARRPYNCTLPPHAPLLASCNRDVEATVTFNVSLAEVVVYYIGVDAHDSAVCFIYRVFSEEDYDASPESEEEDRRRDEWRTEMKLNRQRGTTTSYPPQPTFHSNINDLDETKKRPMPDDVRILPMDDGDFDDDYSDDFVTSLMKDVVALANGVEEEETVMNEKTNPLSSVIGGALMKFSFCFIVAFLFTLYK